MEPRHLLAPVSGGRRVAGAIVMVPSGIALLWTAAWLLVHLQDASAAAIGRTFAIFVTAAILTIAGAWIGGIGIRPEQHPDFACPGCGRPPTPGGAFCKHCGTRAIR